MGNSDSIYTMMDAGTAQVCLSYNPTSHQFQFRRGAFNGTAIGGTYTLIPAAGQWYYVECKFVIDPTVGSCELRIDGVSLLTTTGQDTNVSANAYANSFQLGSTNDNTPNPFVDDLYICDGTGSAPNNTFLGDVRVEYRVPNGNGNSSQLTGSDGNTTDNYLLVDETGNVNDDTDYVESGNVGDKDTYAFENLVSTAGTVYGVNVMPTVRKTDAGARSIKTIARLSGTEVDGPEQILGTGYALMTDIRETKPGGGAWTISDVNSAEFGLKVFA
jgi:hypothetical protein